MLTPRVTEITDLERISGPRVPESALDWPGDWATLRDYEADAPESEAPEQLGGPTKPYV
jgi:hypothetical protein